MYRDGESSRRAALNGQERRDLRSHSFNYPSQSSTDGGKEGITRSLLVIRALRMPYCRDGGGGGSVV
jgi:hypothetical protein